MKWFFLALLMIPLAYAYSVGDNVSIDLHVMNDSVDVTSQACTGSLYYDGSSSFVFYDTPLSVNSSGFHSLNFTLLGVGDYLFSANCYYGGEFADYFRQFTVSGVSSSVTASSGGGGGSYSFVSISNDFDSKPVFDVLSFNYFYKVNGFIMDASNYHVILYLDGSVVDSVLLNHSSIGVYRFSYDFSNVPNGEYEVRAFFDNDKSSTSVVVRHGFFYDRHGLDYYKIGLSALFLVIVVVVLFFVFKKR